jgi:hypothetical protein
MLSVWFLNLSYFGHVLKYLLAGYILYIFMYVHTHTHIVFSTVQYLRLCTTECCLIFLPYISAK